MCVTVLLCSLCKKLKYTVQYIDHQMDDTTRRERPTLLRTLFEENLSSDLATHRTWTASRRAS